MPRTDEDKLLQAPIVMRFGTKNYPVKPLTLGPARAWREKLNEVMGPLAETFQSGIKEDGAVSQGLAKMLMQFPDKLIELILAYDPQLPKDTIMTDATEEQIIVAWSDLLAVAFPFVAPLVTVMRVIRPTRSQ